MLGYKSAKPSSLVDSSTWTSRSTLFWSNNRDPPPGHCGVLRSERLKEVLGRDLSEYSVEYSVLEQLKHPRGVLKEVLHQDVAKYSVLEQVKEVLHQDLASE